MQKSSVKLARNAFIGNLVKGEIFVNFRRIPVSLQTYFPHFLLLYGTFNFARYVLSERRLPAGNVVAIAKVVLINRWQISYSFVDRSNIIFLR